MRCVRKLGLLVAMVVAALAMTASQTSAQSVEVEEFTGGHCGSVTLPSPHEVSGMCEIPVHGPNIQFVVHLSPTTEVTGSICDMEFDGYVASNGTGYITHQSLTGQNCTTPACPETGTNPTGEFALWPFQIREDATSSEELMVTFCTIIFGRVNCEVDLDLEGGPGNYSLEAHDKGCQNIVGYPNVEVTGHWTVEDQTIEIHHLD